LNINNKKNYYLNIKKLSRYLSQVINIGLIAAIAFVVFSFMINIIVDRSFIDIQYIEIYTIKMDDFFQMLSNPGNLNVDLLTYAGLLILITIPVIGLIFTLGYFIRKKNLRLAITSIAVLLIIVLSLIIGFIT
jgi:uncharacterized membrane protein